MKIVLTSARRGSKNSLKYDFLLLQTSRRNMKHGQGHYIKKGEKTIFRDNRTRQLMTNNKFQVSATQYKNEKGSYF
jgi:hypothetical protein